jgi:hypothetical protein
MKLIANIIVMVCVVVTLLVALLLVPRVFGADPSSIGVLPATASAVSSGGLTAEPRPSMGAGIGPELMAQAAPTSSFRWRTSLGLDTPKPVGRWHREWMPWYGPGHYGRRTACGQKLTIHLIGYASRTGKCGDLRAFRWKGKVVIAPRVDWGPNTRSLNFDLTAGLVLALGRVTKAGKPYTTWTEWSYVR